MLLDTISQMLCLLFFFLAITKPTRVTNKSAKLMDNISSKNYVENTSAITVILYKDIRGHFPVFQIDYPVCVPSVNKSFKRVFALWQTWNVFPPKWLK